MMASQLLAMLSQNSLLESNRASGQGGAFSAVSSDGAFFSNVTFRDNSGMPETACPVRVLRPAAALVGRGSSSSSM